MFDIKDMAAKTIQAMPGSVWIPPHDLLWLIRSACGSWNLTRNLSIFGDLFLDETSPSSACNIALHDPTDCQVWAGVGVVDS